MLHKHSLNLATILPPTVSQSKLFFPTEEGQESKAELRGPWASSHCWRVLAFGKAGSEMLNASVVAAWSGKVLTGHMDGRKQECAHMS